VVFVSSEVDVAVSAIVVVASAAVFVVIIFSVVVFGFMQFGVGGLGGPHSSSQVIRSLSISKHFFLSVSYTE